MDSSLFCHLCNELSYFPCGRFQNRDVPVIENLDMAFGFIISLLIELLIVS